MPKYVCSECGEVFQSKEERETHSHGSSESRLPTLRSIRNINVPRLNRMQIAVLGGVFLMSTLFLGTVFFGSSIAPAGGGSSGGSTAFSEPSPPVGYSIQTQADIPDRHEVDLPGGAVSNRQLSTETQLYLLTRPAVLLQYNCNDCRGMVQDMGEFASSFNVERNWVYVAPYRDMNATVSLTAFRRSATMNGFNRTRAESFACSSLRNRPVPCAFR